jgi:GTP-binding protein
MCFATIRFVKSVIGLNERPKSNFPEIAFIGRSNVGKSSMLNSLFKRRNLAKTSSTPGKTRLINYYLLDDHIYLVDLPGYGYIKKIDIMSKNWQKVIETYLSHNKNLKIVFLLIDCRHDLMRNDLMMIEWLSHYKIPFVVVLTKRDKISNNQFYSRISKIKKMIPQVAIIPFSAKSFLGREVIWDVIKEVTN